MKKLFLILGVAILTVCTVAGASEEELPWCELDEETPEVELMSMCSPHPACCVGYAQAAEQQCLAWYYANAEAICMEMYAGMFYEYCAQGCYNLLPPECYFNPSACMPYLYQCINDCMANNNNYSPLIENCVWDYKNKFAAMACYEAGLTAYGICVGSE